MATSPEDVDDEPLVEAEEQDSEQSEPSQQQEPEDDGEELVLAGEESPPQPESASMRQLRDHARKLERELAEARASSQPKLIEVGQKPEWGDGEQWEWDGDKFAAAVSDWHKRKDQAESQQRDQQQASEKAQAEQRRVQEQYITSAASLRARLKVSEEDYREHETAVSSVIPDTVKAALVGNIPNAPAVVHYLGKNRGKLDEIAAIPNQMQQVFALYDLSKGLQMKPRTKSPPPPEEWVSGSGKISQPNHDKELERLEKEADKTGDRTKVIAFKKRMREQGK